MMTSAMGATIDLYRRGHPRLCSLTQTMWMSTQERITETLISACAVWWKAADLRRRYAFVLMATDAKRIRSRPARPASPPAVKRQKRALSLTPYSDKMQHANLYVSPGTPPRVKSQNGKRMYLPATYGGSDCWDVRKISLDYKLMDLSDELRPPDPVTSNTGGSYGSVGLLAATLAETDGESWSRPTIMWLGRRKMPPLARPLTTAEGINWIGRSS